MKKILLRYMYTADLRLKKILRYAQDDKGREEDSSLPLPAGRLAQDDKGREEDSSLRLPAAGWFRMIKAKRPAKLCKLGRSINI